MIERKPLKGSILLYCESDGKRFPRRFQIDKKSSEGTFSLCYEAHYEKSGHGILKEFYPKDAALAIERDETGQLTFTPGLDAAREKFERQLKRYLEAYQMLVEAKQAQETPELETFIPDFEIYYGCDEKNNPSGTAYIWTSGPKREPFEKICGEIHKNPTAAPEYKMVTVLRAAETLTKCICKLHQAGMVHRDIKPSNFGFVRSDGEVLTQTLSMFDVDSICSVYDPPEEVMGTEGFMEPEAAYERPDNQTDIYSIGATLFYAVAGSDEVRDSDFRYRKEYYPRLRELVNMSDLVCASEANAHPRLRAALTRILEKSLCPRRSRYQCCEEMLEDLETALYYALPSEIAKKVRNNEEWVLQNIKKSLDRNKEKNSFLAIQYHLYNYPLYSCMPKNAPVLNVLLAGFGSVGQKFLDACLQVGLLPGKKLSVTVLTDDLSDCDLYLADRPELAEHFNINGSLQERSEVFENVSFREISFSEENCEENSDLLRKYLYELEEEERPHYIFTALEDDAVNLAAADACRKTAQEMGISCAVSCVLENMHFPAKKHPGVQPVFVGADRKKDPNYREIERMAFNCHLIWERNLNVNFRTVREDFLRPYNHDSCVSSVLSLKYKLYGIEIDIDKTGLKKAAVLAEGRALSSSRKNDPVKNELIWLEHRRWMAEKLCQGWCRIRNLEECMNGTTKDERAKRHVCLLPSRPDQMLAQLSAAGRKNLWDAAPESELNKLDDLDRMSVMLHRAYVHKADEVRKKNLLSGSLMRSIRMLLEGNKEAYDAFQEWYICLQEIWIGNSEKERLYKGLLQDFMEEVKQLPETTRKALEEQVKAFEALFDPIRLSIQYQNWKDEDARLIENIPFILTYTEDTYMVIPFETGSSTEVFHNVAAATVVNPARILYLFLADKKQDLKKLSQSFPHIVEYMKKKEIRADVELILAYRDAAIAEEEIELKAKLTMLSDKKHYPIRFMYAADTADFVSKLEAELKKKSRNREFFVLERNKTGLSMMLDGAGLYKRFPNYTFDSEKISFTTDGACEMLRFIQKKPFITATDMASVKRSVGSSRRQPEFYEDYNSLWKKYREDTMSWKLLCGKLAGRAAEQDTLALFRKKENEGKQTLVKHPYLLPFACSRSASRIIEVLKENGIAEKGTCVEAYSSGACKVEILDCCGNKEMYDRLFSHVYELSDPEALSVWTEGKICQVRVCYDDLRADGVRIDGQRKAKLLSLLQYFRDKGFIINLKEGADDKVSFVYGTRQIKELLTTAGKMLEVYTYHKAKETGQFDDVVSSFEIEWEGRGKLRNEFDCILTKGFRTLFVECKARSEIEQDFYFKLVGLARSFGINATTVLIADTQEKENTETARMNELQRTRGEMMDVITIWKKAEIENIGHTLLRIINGKYSAE